VTTAGLAAAQTDVARAENLFREGKALLEEKRFDQACPMFAESARLDPSSGVELALGICYEGQGKVASAWGAFSAAETLARRDARHDREAAASEHVKALESQLSRVTFVVPPDVTSLPGVELFQDGTLLASVSWTGSPVDPGPHSVEVRAPGHVTFSSSFTVKPGGDQVTVSVPSLALLPVPVTPLVSPPILVQSPPPPPPGGTPWKTLGFSGLAAGGASVIVASVLGGLALSKASDVHHACSTNPCADQAAVSENQTAGTLADASTGMFVVGGALAAAGAAVLLFAPSHAEGAAKPATSITVRPTLAPGYAGVGGSF
jgi:hypothetical protein